MIMKNNHINFKRAQQGFNLIELMIGITISLFIVLAAMTALVNSSSTGKTVNDASQLQQQGSVVLRIIGQQIRQASAINLETIAGGDVFLSQAYKGFGGGGNAIQGVNGGTTDTLSTSYHGTADSLDCLGNQSNIAEGEAGEFRVDSTFAVNGTNLECTGSTAAGAQVIAEGVDDFQVRYAVKAGTNIQYVDNTANWASVSAVEVCLDLRNTSVVSALDNPAGTYINCKGVVTPLAGRLHKVFRNTFLLRNQDLP